jgi:hypothetical protein
MWDFDVPEQSAEVEAIFEGIAVNAIAEWEAGNLNEDQIMAIITMLFYAGMTSLF